MSLYILTINHTQKSGWNHLDNNAV